MTPHREIACALLLDRSDRFLLQRRDNNPTILFPGFIGPFGGHREGDETFLECVVREIHEEIGLFLAPGRFTLLARYQGFDFETTHGGTSHAEFFVARDVPVEHLMITEGKLVIAETGKLGGMEKEFTPALRFALGAFFRAQS